MYPWLDFLIQRYFVLKVAKWEAFRMDKVLKCYFPQMHVEVSQQETNKSISNVQVSTLHDICASISV